MQCQSCGRNAPLREAEFVLYIGALITHFHIRKGGRLCTACIHKTFWACTLTTLLLGWWSLPSLFFTPIMLVFNLVSYLGTFLMRPYPVEPFVLPPPWEVVQKLRPYRDEIFERLLKGEAMAQVAAEIAARVGASPEQVRAFYNSTR
jgi:hypothetical protein